MGYTTAAKTDVESRMPEEWGGIWFLRDALDTEHLGVTVLELEPGGKGKEHDHAGTGHEEVYYVLSGEVAVEVEDGSVTLGPDDAVRLDPEETRQIHNPGADRATLLLVGASG